jgi:hypothetical protein
MIFEPEVIRIYPTIITLVCVICKPIILALVIGKRTMRRQLLARQCLTDTAGPVTVIVAINGAAIDLAWTVATLMVIYECLGLCLKVRFLCRCRRQWGWFWLRG